VIRLHGSVEQRRRRGASMLGGRRSALHQRHDRCAFDQQLEPSGSRSKTARMRPRGSFAISAAWANQASRSSLRRSNTAFTRASLEGKWWYSVMRATPARAMISLMPTFGTPRA